MATKKKETVSTQDAFRQALLNLARLDFEVRLDDGQQYARVRHPLALAYLGRGETVSFTKVHFRDFQDRVEVDGKRVAKTEILDRTVAATLMDIEKAQRAQEYAEQQATKRDEQYAALIEAGVDSAAKGMPFAKKYATVADRLRLETEGSIITLQKGDTGDERDRIILTISAANGSLPVVAAALKAARKAAKA